MNALLICRRKPFVQCWHASKSLCPKGCLRSDLFAVLKLFSEVSHTSPFCHEGVDVHQWCQELERNLKSRLFSENRRWEVELQMSLKINLIFVLHQGIKMLMLISEMFLEHHISRHIRMISEGSCDTEDWSNIITFSNICNCYFKL